MKKLALAVSILAVSSVSAFAADLAARPYTKAPAYVAPVYSWTGFYLGGHVGGAWEGHGFGDPFVSTSNSAAFLGGLQGGYNYQFAPNWVVGIEGEYSWTGLNRSGAGTIVTPVFGAPALLTPVALYDNLRGLGAVTGRIGYTWGAGLLYAKGGVGFADYQAVTATTGGTPIALAISGNNSVGYTVGGGLEYLFNPNWSAKVEYQYYGFGHETFTATAPVAFTGTVSHNVQTAKAGFNYHFNWGGPVVAKY